MILQFQKKIVFCGFLLFFPMFLVNCSKSFEVDNQFVTVTVPNEYSDITNFVQGDVLFLDYLKTSGLESILSIDKEQDFTTQPNSQTILEDTPLEVLSRRLRSIEESCKDPEFPWKNFKVVEVPKIIKFKGYPAAEAIFEVDEYVKYRKGTVFKRVKRIVLFTEDDLWNIVLAPSEFQCYKEEMEIFEIILEDLVIKK